MAAAVADFTPVEVQQEKIKEKKEIAIKFVPTKDIAAQLGAMKRRGQLLVGFALETHNETENAVKKRSQKNFDFIVMNSLNDVGAGFRHETNKITIIDHEGHTHFELKSKDKVAKDIVDKLVACWRDEING
jgi:phosphopantothenoylcysteine decarboxylase/phosphopantothenate--cysteine ligase